MGEAGGDGRATAKGPRGRAEVRGTCQRCRSAPARATLDIRIVVGATLVPRRWRLCGPCLAGVVKFLDGPTFEQARAAAIDLGRLVPGPPGEAGRLALE